MRTLFLLPLTLIGLVACSQARDNNTGPLTGTAALGDWSTDSPGVRRKLTPADLPKPGDTPSVDNGPRYAPQPEGAWPKAPAGFTVERFAEKLWGVRVLKTAPNGDIFAVDSNRGRVLLLRDENSDGKIEFVQVFAKDLVKPFGLAFWPSGNNPKYLYVGNTDSVVRIPYQSGDSVARGKAETVVDNIPGGGRLRGGGHWTRAVAFSKDDKTLFVSVGSISNNDDPEVNKLEERRACVLAYTPEGKNERIFASGIRNAVGLAVQPGTGTLFCSVNERDGLGDMLVPDYVSSVKEGGFYGWPYFYIGGNEDPRHAGKKPDLKSKVIVPDVLLQSHSASLDLCFSSGQSFPKAWRGGIFAAEHGSWNRARRTGYKVVYIPTDKKGKPTGEYIDFLTGFVKNDAEIWGRPVGVTVAKDGALLVCDDASAAIWRIRWTGGK
jgi:glucose/arabinose dehydrogenase